MTKQKSAEKDEFDLREFLPFLLNQAAEECSLEFQRIYKNRYGMLRTEWRVLFHLGIYGEMTARDIGSRAKIHKTKISRAVRRLEQRRYLQRLRDQNDRRIERLSLTTSGQVVYRELRGIARDYDEELATRFTTDEAALLRMMLRRLARMD